MRKNNIILKASAGTGKTYRLSLEFIANLIRGVNYKNIVVMTFTKKATAEIKERIYDFLHQIAFNEGNGAELEKNLKEIYKFDNLNKNELQNIYFEMIKNKEDIRISTIDGFTNQIFKNAIAPYFNTYNYEILDKETDEFYSKILIKIIENKEIFKDFEFIIDEKKEKKNIKKYMEIIEEMLGMQSNFVLAKDFEMMENEEKVSYNFLNNLDDIVNTLKKAHDKKKSKSIYRKKYENFFCEYIKILENQKLNENEKLKEKIKLVEQNDALLVMVEDKEPYWINAVVGDTKKIDMSAERESAEKSKDQLKERLSKYIYLTKILP